jgi:hypothetical protein
MLTNASVRCILQRMDKTQTAATIRFDTPADLQKVKRAAAKMDMSVSRYARRRLLEIATKELAEDLQPSVPPTTHTHDHAAV